ncbi:MAG: trans-sulfuration enzyme family protein [Candidatus Syntropharchaeia archaeon]
MNKKGFSTRAIHAGEFPCPVTGALTTPIYQTSTFVFKSTEQLESIIEGREKGYAYTRFGNPTQTVLEEKMADLEGGESALAFSSGMAAISAPILSEIKKGDRIISSDVIYGCTYDLFTGILRRLGVETVFVDTSDPANVEDAITENTRFIFIETPANPTMKISDIEGISEIAGDAKVMVDSTFISPYFLRPLELGADIVVHSATKYIGGHADVLAGIAIGDAEFMGKVRRTALKDVGGAISPFDAWLLIRGLKTLSIRMERHQKNAMEVAKFLESHPSVKRVFYPGLESHPQYELARRQMSGFGGMLSFEVENERVAKKLVNSVELCSFAVSLGAVETLIEHPASMSHRNFPEKEKLGITSGLIRLSVGLEDAEDIIEDLERGLKFCE